MRLKMKLLSILLFLSGNAKGEEHVIWRHKGGLVAAWAMSGGSRTAASSFTAIPGLEWVAKGVGDFDGDGISEITWLYAPDGKLSYWKTSGAGAAYAEFSLTKPANMELAATGDFDGDGTDDFVMMEKIGNPIFWKMKNLKKVSQNKIYGSVVGGNWDLATAADINFDGTDDLIWVERRTGDISCWFMSKGRYSHFAIIGKLSQTETIVAAGDITGDGNDDLIIKDSSDKLLYYWESNGKLLSNKMLIANIPDYSPTIDATWDIVGLGTFK